MVCFAFLAKMTIAPKGGAVQSLCGAKIVSGMSWINRMLESRDFGPISLSFAQGFTFPFDLEFHQYSRIYLSACQVVGYCVVVVVDVLYPVVGVYVFYAEYVECVYTQPYVLEPLSYAGAVSPVLVVEKAV